MKPLSPSPIKIMLVDDHPMVRDGLSACLSFYDDIDIVGACNDGTEVLNTTKQCLPDVILMDISMPNQNGLEATEIIKEAFPDTKILIFSMHESAEFVKNAVHSGASGYILKDTDSEEVYQAIKTVAQGRPYFGSNIAQMLLTNSNTPSNERLTAREQMVLSQIATGQSSKAIAQTLNISVRTVEAHRRNIKSKLNINNLAELVRYAIEQGLVKES